MAMPVKTEVEWAYAPADYFEGPFHARLEGATAHFAAGTTTVTLDVPVPHLTAGQRADLEAGVRAVLLARQLLTRRAFRLTLSDSTVVQHEADGGRVLYLILEDRIAIGDVHVDLVVTDAAGQVVHDSAAERRARDEDFVTALAPKLARSPVLRALLESYTRSVHDPDDELTHLYELRDALAAHYGGEQAALTALLPAGVTRAGWRRLGELANALPVLQGRHRGKSPGALRPATTAELTEARALARQLVEAFAAGV